MPRNSTSSLIKASNSDVIEPCYGIVKDSQNRTVVLPIIARKSDSKVALCGIAEDGTLVEPEDAKDLLKKLGIQTWLQGRTLTPLKSRPTFWQRGLLSAVSRSTIVLMPLFQYWQHSHPLKACGVNSLCSKRIRLMAY